MMHVSVCVCLNVCGYICVWWGSRARMKGGVRPLHLKWGLPRVELGHGCFCQSPVLYAASSAFGIGSVVGWQLLR